MAYGTGVDDARVQGRTDRRNFTVSFNYDAGKHLIRRSQVVSSVTIAQDFQPAESRGLPGTVNGAAQPVDSAYTLLDGPRTDVADVMRFWTNGLGAPIKIRNAHGRETKVIFDATWLGLAKELRSVGGAITQAFYNARGLVDSSRVLNLRSNGDAPATTRYAWHATLPLPTQITQPQGEVTYYTYYADGNVESVQQGNDPGARVYAFYYPSGDPAAGLYRASTIPGRAERDSVSYDATLGNPIGFKDRKGNWSYSDRDARGLVRQTRTLVAAGLWRSDSTQYDLADQPIRQVSFGPSTSYDIGFGTENVPADTLIVRTTYDPEGNVTEVARWSVPNRANVDTAKTWSGYDDAGRKTSESSTGIAEAHFDLDPAGNIVRRMDGIAITDMQYDALGRLTKRVTSKMIYPRTYCTFFQPYGSIGTCNFYFPLSTASTSSSLTIPGDTAYFAYDAAGNVLRADNASARIRRSYSPAGLLLTDTLRIRTLRYAAEGNTVPAVDFNSHVYGLVSAYDLDGRRISLTHPDAIDPCSGSCPAQQYAYQPYTGRLDHVTDVRGQTVGFQYNVAGQLERVNYPSGISEYSQYDAEGLVTVRTVGSTGSSFIADTLQYDPIGRVTTGRGRDLRYSSGQSILNFYSGLGALTAQALLLDTGTPKREEFKSDALANTYWSRRHNVHLGNSSDSPAIRNSTFDAPGRIVNTASPDELSYDDVIHYWYDSDGLTTFKGTRFRDPQYSAPVRYTQEAHYYDGTRRLVLLERHTGESQQQSLYNDKDALIESYRYDALGRRVLVHTNRTNACELAGCERYVTRYVLDGDEVLYEIRAPASDATSTLVVEGDSPGGDGEYGWVNAYGVASYTHAGGIDRPIGVIRNVAFYPHANWRGLYETATRDDGTLLPNAIAWPGQLAAAHLGATPRSTPYEWFGGLLTEQADASGLLYRRNRYYDPISGRFTQPDPIGVTGGLNVYGFAAGDPVNYSDPFGLSPVGCEPVCPPIPGPAGVAGGAAGLGAAVAAAAAAANNGALASLIDKTIDQLREKLSYRFVTYTRVGPNGQVYSGRTSGFGDPQSIVKARAATHPDRLAGFSEPKVDMVASGYEGALAIWGREQQLIDFHGRAQSEEGSSANIIRAVGKNNPAGPYLWRLSNRYFLPLAPYTGKP